MARYTPGILPDGQELRLSLDRYQELMKILCPCAFNGVERHDTGECCDCKSLWTQDDRDALAIAIGQAEEMREQQLGYYLAPVYTLGEELDIRLPAILSKKHLIAVGSKVCTDVALNVALSLSAGGTASDPIVFTAATTVTDTSELHVFIHGEDVEIHPSSIIIAGGTATITIPRCRLLLTENLVNCEPFPDYTDDSNFVSAVDVKRCYTDESLGAYYVWHGQTSLPSCCSCENVGETTHLLYPRITNKRLSIVELFPAHYNSGTWTKDCSATACCYPAAIRVNYLSGRKSSVMTQMTTIALAHTLLPYIIPERIENLCAGCWSGDLEEAGEGIDTPYGHTKGAVKAWYSDSQAKIGFGGKFPAMPVHNP